MCIVKCCIAANNRASRIDYQLISQSINHTVPFGLAPGLHNRRNEGGTVDVIARESQKRLLWHAQEP